MDCGPPAALLAYTALRELDLSNCHLRVLPDLIGGLTQLTKFTLTSDSMTEVPSCVLKLCQLVELTVMTKHLSLNILQLASWPDLRCLEIGVTSCYRKAKKAVVVDKERDVIFTSFNCHADALKEAFSKKHPKAVVHVYTSKKFKPYSFVQQDWMMKVLV